MIGVGLYTILMKWFGIIFGTPITEGKRLGKTASIYNACEIIHLQERNPYHPLTPKTPLPTCPKKEVIDSFHPLLTLTPPPDLAHDPWPQDHERVLWEREAFWEVTIESHSVMIEWLAGAYDEMWECL